MFTCPISYALFLTFFPPTKAELSSCDRLYTKLKVFPNLFFFFLKHCHQSLWGDSIRFYDFSYFLAPGGQHMLAHISLHSLRLLLNPFFYIDWLWVCMGNCSPVELRGQSAGVRFLLPPHGFHELKEGQACEPSWQPFSLIFNLPNPLPHSVVSQKEYTPSPSKTISFLLCTAEGLEITLWSCTSGHAMSCHLYFRALNS